MVDLIRRWFRARRPRVLPEESRGADVLAFIGANPLAVSWARRQPQGLDGQWESCPRADWLLDIAHRAGLPLERVARAARSLELEVGASSWTTIDALLADLTPALDQAVEGDPTYLEKRNVHLPPDFSGGGGTTAADMAGIAALEDLHRELHARHTRAVREAIPYRDIRAALYGQVDGPYR